MEMVHIGVFVCVCVCGGETYVQGLKAGQMSEYSEALEEQLYRMQLGTITALVEMSKHLHRDRKYLASLLCFLDISADFDTVLYTYPFYSNPRTVMHLPTDEACDG